MARRKRRPRAGAIDWARGKTHATRALLIGRGWNAPIPVGAGDFWNGGSFTPVLPGDTRLKLQRGSVGIVDRDIIMPLA